MLLAFAKSILYRFASQNYVFGFVERNKHIFHYSISYMKVSQNQNSLQQLFLGVGADCRGKVSNLKEKSLHFIYVEIYSNQRKYHLEIQNYTARFPIFAILFLGNKP